VKPCKRWEGKHNVRTGRPVDNSQHVPRIAYRVIYEREHGPIPEGCNVHHTCHNGWCVEPSHLVALTEEEHRQQHQRTHCPKGHPLEGDNVYVPPRHPNQRACKTCRRDTNREWMRAHR
jgi:HNH endonuclease